MSAEMQDIQRAALSVLRQIERGEVTVTPNRLPFDVFAGDVTYKASNGWEFVVFNDCNDWDYVDSFTTSSGVTVSPWEEDMEELKAYRPSDSVAEEKWGFSDTQGAPQE